MPTIALLQELNPSSIPGQPCNTHVNCALCGTAIISPSSTSGSSSPVGTTFPPPSHRPGLNNTWSSSLFKNSLVHTLSAPGSFSHSRNQSPVRGAPAEPPAQIYIFRIAATSSGLPVSLPLSPQNNTQAKPTIYPLCTTHWCLARLRTTCSMWAYIRTGIVEKVWEDGVYVPPASLRAAQPPAAPNGAKSDNVNGVSAEKPPVPPRRARMGIGALWGSVQRSLSGKEVEAEKELEKKEVEKPLPGSPKKLPMPPPVHPSISAPAPNRPPTIPPPLPPRSRGREAAAKPVAPTEPSGSTTDHAEAPPPLERIVSADHFTTPAEEPAAFISSDPAAVPLPPTAPATPEPHQDQSGEVAPAAQSEQAAAPSTVDVQTPVVAPAPAPAVVAANLQEPAGSRSGSPAPPPLPRRAAARPRPVSVVVPLEPAAADGTDGAQAVPAPETLTEAKDEATAATEPATSTDAAKPSDAAAAGASEATDSNEAGKAEASEQAPPADVPSTATEEVPQPDADTSSKQPNGIEHADPDPSTDGVEAGQLGVTQEEEPDTLLHSPVAPSTNGVVDGVEGQSLKDLETADIRSSPEPETNGEAEDPALYVGDATWEERTWKELTRLREDMFWARVGGVR